MRASSGGADGSDSMSKAAWTGPRNLASEPFSVMKAVMAGPA